MRFAPARLHTLPRIVRGSASGLYHSHCMLGACYVPLHLDGLQQRVCSWGDRKSTRLNSSHSQISYAVFCLKKKKTTTTRPTTRPPDTRLPRGTELRASPT